MSHFNRTHISYRSLPQLGCNLLRFYLSTCHFLRVYTFRKRVCNLAGQGPRLTNDMQITCKTHPNSDSRKHLCCEQKLRQNISKSNGLNGKFHLIMRGISNMLLVSDILWDMGLHLTVFCLPDALSHM